ncbi:recombination regulator RecX [Pararhizobium sp.]|uniref:recombination regulator RecX n=1 Tax=Pararhizobium sp. TaxID=1977563 RepID=UPI0027162405|nr:recombination regulator RecX [Pararhizobium sp.]MDO9418091.1 recombination regulator RecX [Pararhizobium sp.]
MFDDETQSDIPTARMLAWAKNSAIWRLARKMMSERELSDAISRKARAKFPDIGAAQLKAVAAFAVEFAHSQNALNDVAYAEVSARSGVRSGKSKKMIAQKLSAKGIGSDAAVAALEETDDLHAALVFARKRGFGPFRRGALDDRRKAKELSAFARNGFAFEIGKRVFEMTAEDAEELLAAGPASP